MEVHWWWLASSTPVEWRVCPLQIILDVTWNMLPYFDFLKSWVTNNLSVIRRHRIQIYLLPPPRRLCFTCVCLSVCLSVNRITQKLLNKSLKFYGHNPRTNRLDSEWPWPKVKARKSKLILRINPFKTVAESRRNILKCRLINSLNSAVCDYGRGTDSFNDH